MQKRWILFSIVVLLMQFFIPLTAVAETLNVNDGTIEIIPEVENSELKKIFQIVCLKPLWIVLKMRKR